MTPADQIDIITGALAGTANKTLLAWAKKHQIAAVGLFLGDGDSVKVTQLDEELGYVGLAQPGSPKLINTLLENGYLPVVSSIGVTDEGQLMNVNADQAATALAATLGADLILLSDVSGILDGKGQRIAEMTAAKAEQLIEQGIITDGMIVKVNAALDAARTLGRPVDIASWRHAEQLPALFNGMPMGTRILACFVSRRRSFPALNFKIRKQSYGTLGRAFYQAADQRFKQFNDSLRFDYRLAEQDIVGSVAWSKALVTVGVLTAEEQAQLEEALNVLLEDVRARPQQILESDAEDIHSWVEGKLIDKVGQLGKKLHTGRSRNDQVATDLKLWCKDTVSELLTANRQLQSALVETAQNNQDA